MAYLGLVPSEQSSGERIRRGGITRTGNCEARRHVSPNTAFKMIEEIEDELTLNTIEVAAKRVMMLLGQLLLNYQ